MSLLEPSETRKPLQTQNFNSWKGIPFLYKLEQTTTLINALRLKYLYLFKILVFRLSLKKRKALF